MTEEEKKKAAEAAEADSHEEEDADADTEEEAEDSEDSEEEKAEDTDTEPDFEAELKAERARADEAEKKLNSTRDKARERFEKRKKKEEDGTDDEEEPEEERPLTRTEFQDLLRSEREATRKELSSNRAADHAGKITRSDSEKRLTLEIFKNRSWPSHLTIEEQIEEANLLANKKRFVSERNEALRALKNKGTQETSAADTHRKPPAGKEPKLHAADAVNLKRDGFVYDAASKTYVKKMPNGTLVHDPKTRKNTFRHNHS